ncbi:MAG: HD domain-containing protein [Anaerolineae bacterium]
MSFSLTGAQRELMGQYVRAYLIRSAEKFGHRHANLRSSARWTHSLSVVKNVLLILEGENTDEETRAVCEVAALFHDIDHYTVQSEYHAAKGAETATHWLTKQGYDPEFIKRVAAIIRDHHTDLEDDVSVEEQVAHIEQTYSYETRIVMDADTLDKIGASNILQAVLTMSQNGQRLADVARELTSGWPLQRASLWKQILTTTTGKRLGEDRYAFYESFLAQVAQEIVFDDPYPTMTMTQEVKAVSHLLASTGK